MVTNNLNTGPTASASPFRALQNFSKNATYRELDPLTIAELVAKLEELPRAKAFPVYLKDGKEVPNVRRITTPENDPDITYYVGTERYEVVQHQEIGNELLRAVRETGADMRGIFRTNDNGSRWYGTLLWEDQREFEKLKDYGEPFKWGVNFSNSYDGGRSLDLESFGVRMICVNYNMWGDLLERMRVKHLTSDNLTSIVDKMSSFMDKLVDSINTTFPHVYEASCHPLGAEVRELLPALIVGHGITGVAQAATIAREDNLRRLVPEADEEISRWDAYNAVTAFLTHYRSNISEETAHTGFRAATKLLDETEDDRALDRGRKKIENAKRGAAGYPLEHYSQKVQDFHYSQEFQDQMA